MCKTFIRQTKNLNIKTPFKGYNTSHRHTSYNETGDRGRGYVEVHQLTSLEFAVVNT